MILIYAFVFLFFFPVRPLSFSKADETAVNNTIAKRCNKHYFIMTTDLHIPNIINSEHPDNRSYLIHKVRNVFEFIHDNYMDDVDWVFKAGDATYAIVENLRFLLSHYNASKPGSLGFLFDKFITNGFMSGGAAYVLCIQSIRQLVQNGLPENKCPALKKEELPGLGEDFGRNCCNQFTNTFRYMNPRLLRLADHLLYTTLVYGRTLPRQVMQVRQYRP
ncbi:hypothetical protein ACJMK2_037501 [Sinanodonta woodiana]|uniref:Uncharacterized protein n=1 Tax=Sinanodonta woodiana TaxID=1069815 RepID=A0ABD3WP41_SINWO